MSVQITKKESPRRGIVILLSTVGFLAVWGLFQGSIPDSRKTGGGGYINNHKTTISAESNEKSTNHPTNSNKAASKRSGKSQAAIVRERLTSKLPLEPLASTVVIEAFVQAHDTPGAYATAAGASRNKTWLQAGLERFPNHPTLLRARALWEREYLSDPTLVATWKEAEPRSGWPDVLVADIELGKNNFKAAYDAIKIAFNKELSLDVIPEIGVFLSETGANPWVQNFVDVGEDEGKLTERLSLELRLNAQMELEAGNLDGSNNYAAAALALSDFRSESENSFVSLTAAQAASHALKLLGPEGARSFLHGVSFDEAKQRYAEIQLNCLAEKQAALAYKKTLTGEAKIRFGILYNDRGPKKALEIVKQQDATQ